MVVAVAVAVAANYGGNVTNTVIVIVMNRQIDKHNDKQKKKD